MIRNPQPHTQAHNHTYHIHILLLYIRCTDRAYICSICMSHFPRLLQFYTLSRQERIYTFFQSTFPRENIPIATFMYWHWVITTADKQLLLKMLPFISLMSATNAHKYRSFFFTTAVAYISVFLVYSYFPFSQLCFSLLRTVQIYLDNQPRITFLLNS